MKKSIVKLVLLIAVTFAGMTSAFAADLSANGQVPPEKLTPAEVLYPANDFVPLGQLKKVNNVDLQIPEKGVVNKVKLTTWGQVVKQKRISNNEISPNRQVYVVEVSYPEGLALLHGKLKKGTLYRVLDAQTGEVLGGVVDYNAVDFTPEVKFQSNN